jgi:hypothetical protein
LPAVITGDAWIIAESDETGTVELNDIEASVSLVCIERSADIARQAIAAITTAARDADPIAAAGRRAVSCNA